MCVCIDPCIIYVCECVFSENRRHTHIAPCKHFKIVYVMCVARSLFHRQRPYHVEYTGSRPITEVKQRRARLVLGWVTAWEHRVPLPFCCCNLIFFIHFTTPFTPTPPWNIKISSILIFSFLLFLLLRICSSPKLSHPIDNKKAHD